MIEKAKGGYRIRSKSTGHLYPKVYSTKDDAKERERQMQMFKHVRKPK